MTEEYVDQIYLTTCIATMIDDIYLFSFSQTEKASVNNRSEDTKVHWQQALATQIQANARYLSITFWGVVFASLRPPLATAIFPINPTKSSSQ